MTDFRALCGEILQLLDYYIPEDGRPTCWDPWRQRARAARRPKPPCLAEEAFAALSKIENNEATYGDAGIIFKALHKLQQYEQQKNKKN